MERVQRRVEDDGVRDRVLIDDAKTSVADYTAAPKAACDEKIAEVKPGDLPKPAAGRVHGEDLAGLVEIRFERVGEAQEEGAPPRGVDESAERIRAPEARDYAVGNTSRAASHARGGFGRRVLEAWRGRVGHPQLSGPAPSMRTAREARL